MVERRELPLIACTLDGDAQVERAAEWRALVRRALSWERVERGAVVRFAETESADVRRLVEAERACCAFFEFEVESRDAEVSMRLCAPDDAISLVYDLLGVN